MMIILFKSTGSARHAVALLLLSVVLLPGPGARADTATMRRCAHKPDYRRVLETDRDIDVTILNLIDCGLNQTEFESDAFDGSVLPNLKEILLHFNNLEHLTPGVFSPVDNITELTLSHNKLHEVPVCDAHSQLPRLIKLVLNFNCIATISESTFTTCANLEYLHLDQNVIKYVHPTAFLKLTNLRTISLNYNNITSVPDSMFNIKSLDTVNLQHNLIEYVSPRAFSGTKLTHLDLHGNRISFLPEYFMSELNGAGGHLDYHYFTTNPWHCSCLLEHLADVKRAGVVLYSTWWYDGKEPMCVFTGRYACHRHYPSPLLPQIQAALNSH
ncbi:chondroadherin-like [Cydia pomonella]|uniref:chondroadherin-like n=1 Tax=Cydia pomonella TaxID=82600 RepID=UPI002ADE1F60|nr:chondroadherin-like [Cydia pomonella]